MTKEEEQIRESCWFKEKIKLLTPDGYENRYYEYVRQGFTHRISWEKTETERVEFFNVSGYASYESFKVTINKKKRQPS